MPLNGRTSQFTRVLVSTLFASMAVGQTVISTVAGGGASLGDGRNATNATFASPYGVAADGAGNLYIADANNNRVRKVVLSTGVVTTIAGNGTAGFSGDGGLAVNAMLNFPAWVAVDGSGNLYISDRNNNRVRKVALGTGVISSVAGNGQCDVPANGSPPTSVPICSPRGLAVDSDGNLYIAGNGTHHILKVVFSTNSISKILAGSTVFGINSDPTGLALDGNGNLYYTDGPNDEIWKMVVSTGISTLVAGDSSGLGGFAGDGGPAANARFNNPQGLAVDGAGNLYIADQGNNRIRKIFFGLNGVTINTVVGNGTTAVGDGSPATSFGLNGPTGVAFDSGGNLSITDQNNRIRRVNKLFTGELAPTIRVNAGGGVYVDPLGQTWSADSGFSGGSTYGVTSPIANTSTPYLYQSERWNSSAFSYQVNAPFQFVHVVLKFAEIFFSKPGQRVFNVVINGTQVLTNFDIIAAAGAANTAIDMDFVILPNNGTITVQFVPVVSNPKISAIEIHPLPVHVGVTPSVATLSAGQSQQFTAAVNDINGGSSNVFWSVIPAVGTISSSGLYTAPVVLPGPQTVTITATSATTLNQSASATVTLNSPWNTLDIGNVPTPGTYSYTSGAHTLQGSGNVDLASDKFRFVYQTFGGDGEIVARVNTSFSPNFTKVGVMMRESTSPDARHAFLSVFSGIVALLETRQATGGGTLAQFGAAGIYWLRLTRVGNTFTGYVSNEGISWLQVGAPQTIAMGGSMFAGLAISSGTSTLAGAVIDNVQIVPSPIAISIDQTLVSMVAGQGATFTANAPAIWSMSPPAGAIDSSGLFTASADTSQRTVTITATSTADPGKNAAVVARIGSFTPVRVNAGGPSHIDPNGVFWNGDTGSSAGSSYSSGTPIAGTTTPYLYQSEHFNAGALQYSYVVPNGNYTVNLKFAEIFFTGAGQRVFNASINGTPVLTNFDIVAQAGAANKAVDRQFPVSVSSGLIVIQFTPVVSAPKINAIEITP